MKNFVLNGAMYFDQNKEGGYYYSAFNEVYSLDQWRYSGGENGGAYSIRRAQFPSTTEGFKYCLHAGVTTQQVTLTASDNFHIEYPIEGICTTPWSFGTPNASNLTLSFYVVATVAGEYSFAMMNGINTRSYVTSFTVTTANVVQKVEITIPGDTSGVWSTDIATFGAKLIWSLGVGSMHSTSTTETWQGVAYWNKPGTVQLVTLPAGSTNLYIFGVQLEMGDTATSFEFLEYTQELLMLQRYYYKTFPQGTAVGNQKGITGSVTYISQNAGVNGGGQQWAIPVAMESSPPVITTYNPGYDNSNWYNSSNNTTSGTPSMFNAGDMRSFIYNPQISTDTKGACLSIHAVANARLGGS